MSTHEVLKDAISTATAKASQDIATAITDFLDSSVSADTDAENHQLAELHGRVTLLNHRVAALEPSQ
jgi:hypothetical protein